ncbi:hypothetical protein CXF68_09160 [Tenacibaculum sp. Bg11-29]|uniref:hypothetical protein n=1 Tax=Tenacibaculum sp. Bg11-29 TaxID=2058306 RepID=UPI000C34CF58|nr:hypothetical protein [Tenacibaculum sp. Bg11-29]PKH50844.1 hypothetical protein CXF68_09160 [Tenacibaculum sp. Bg11-29]
MINTLNQPTTVKHIKIIQECPRCKKTVCNAHRIVNVRANFSVSEIRKSIAVYFKKAKCKQHPFAALVTTYSFHHSETITTNN